MKIIVNPIPNDKTRNIMALLPIDIVFYNILTKVPAKSLLRFKSVCKDWYNLINSSNFRNIQHTHTLESHDSSDFLVVSSRCGVLVNQFLFYIMYLDAPNYTHGKSRTFDSCWDIVGSSNGLICLKNLGSGFLLWNPVTKEYSRLIKSPSSLASVHISFEYYGFGYDVVSHDYKIVNIEFRDAEFRRDCIFHVYSRGSNSWKESQKYPDSILGYKEYFGRNVVVNNKLHWITFKRTAIKIILIFDLHTEELREISYPTSLRHAKEHDLMVSRGRLCILATTHWPSKHPNVSIWVMKEYGVVESWTKLYEVEGEQISSKYFRIITHQSKKDGEEVLLQKHDKNGELVWYDLENKSITGKVDDPATEKYAGHTWVCIASLAPIPGNDNSKTVLSM
ncbi:F-box protein CPR1-like [Silene latifolia]|uniref:F-box protein CPR1-like n=1 Tax=Silene latifolia TaxID=37657 RepID=UPI003D77B82A